MARFTAVLFTITAMLAATMATPVPAEQALEARALSGKATWYNTGLGACGWTNKDSEKVVALAAADYNGGKNCGKFVKITNTANKKTTRAKVVDMCPGCKHGSLDLTPAAFKAIGSLDTGVLSITYTYD